VSYISFKFHYFQ